MAGLSTLAGSIAADIIKELLMKGAGTAWENKNTMSLFLKTTFGKYRNERVRFTISYLYRIQIPGTDSYLLVPNRRIQNLFQPVGGAYKRYRDDEKFESWDYQPDRINMGLGTDDESEFDLRFSVTGKYVLEVIRWFEKEKGREINRTREFNEELLETGILPEAIFKSIHFQNVKRVLEALKWSVFHNCFEVKIFDVVELLPDESQKRALKDLKYDCHYAGRKYVIASCDEIVQQRLVSNGNQIARLGDHTKHIINHKC